HRAFEHSRMSADRLLDLDARDVLAAGDNDVLVPVAELDVAVRVPYGEITGVEPAAAKRLLGRCLVRKVAAHHVVAAHYHLAHPGVVARDVIHVLVDDADKI